jgi:dTDP-4-dehydrorhamnose reductase
MPSDPHGTILVTGGSGQVGGALIRTLAHLGEIVAPGSGELNLSDAEGIRRFVREHRPRWIVNAAAYIAVDKAESEPDLALAINATAPRILGEEAAGIGAGVIHFSTDYVFDGAKSAAYIETDATGPLNEYGRSKLAGEAGLQESGAACFIFRTSWVYGATGNNFVRTMLRLAREREHLKVVGDQRGGPTWSFELARMTAHVIERVDGHVQTSGGPLVEVIAPVSGVYHATGSGETTWCQFAAAAIEELQKLEPQTRLATVEAISTSEYPTPAKRPMNSRLDCAKLEQVLGWRMPEWRDSVAAVVRKLALT